MALSSITAASAIAQLQSQWRRAMTTRDTAFFTRTLADDFQLTGGQSVLTKAEFLAAVATGAGRVPPGRPEETRIHIYGNVAVVTGLIRYEMPGGAAPILSRYTEVWVKQGERWLAVHGHYNAVSAPPARAGP
jgi:ketosteroid isomerase-like protein